MEDTLRERTNNKKIIWEVLILVVMEDTLREMLLNLILLEILSLNPCFNGRYSQREKKIRIFIMPSCLNPCSNGRYSQSAEQG